MFRFEREAGGGSDQDRPSEAKKDGIYVVFTLSRLQSVERSTIFLSPVTLHQSFDCHARYNMSSALKVFFLCVLSILSVRWGVEVRPKIVTHSICVGNSFPLCAILYFVTCNVVLRLCFPF